MCREPHPWQRAWCELEGQKAGGEEAMVQSVPDPRGHEGGEMVGDRGWGS